MNRRVAISGLSQSLTLAMVLLGSQCAVSIQLIAQDHCWVPALDTNNRIIARNVNSAQSPCGIAGPDVALRFSSDGKPAAFFFPGDSQVAGRNCITVHGSGIESKTYLHIKAKIVIGGDGLAPLATVTGCAVKHREYTIVSKGESSCGLNFRLSLWCGDNSGSVWCSQKPKTPQGKPAGLQCR